MAAIDADFGKLSATLVHLSGGAAVSGFGFAVFLGEYTFSGPSATVDVGGGVHVHGELNTSNCLAAHCDAGAEVKGLGAANGSARFFANDGDVASIDFFLPFVTGPIDTFSALIGVSVPIGFQIEIFGGISGGGFGVSTVAADFGNTVSFNTEGPVFVLPPGFTASGPCVEDNLYVCGTTATPVPEPTSLLLLGTGLACAVGRRRLEL